MNVENLLNNYNDYKAQVKKKENIIKRKEIEIAEYEDEIASTNLSVNGDIKAKNKVSDKIEEIILKRQKKFCEINLLEAKKNELKSKVDLVDELLKILKPEHQRMLEMKFKANLSLETIARDVGRNDTSSVSRTISDCIKKMEEIYQC